MSTIAVIGRYNAGKSSFLNAILKSRNLLPTDMSVCTKKVAFVQDGEDERVEFVDKDYLRTIIPLQEFSRNQEENYSSVKYFNVFKAGNKILKKEKIIFIDTPGYNANDEDDTSIDFGLNYADTVLIILFEREIGNSDAQLIEKALKKYKISNLHVVFNKIDEILKNVPESNWEEELGKLREVIETRLKEFDSSDRIRFNFFSSLNFQHNKPDIWTQEAIRDIDSWLGGVAKSDLNPQQSDDTIISILKDKEFIYPKLKKLLPNVNEHVHFKEDWTKSIYMDENCLYGISFPFYGGSSYFVAVISRRLKSELVLKIAVLFAELNYAEIINQVESLIKHLDYTSRFNQGYFEGYAEFDFDWHNPKMMELKIADELSKALQFVKDLK